jgi:hypothetical protein
MDIKRVGNGIRNKIISKSLAAFGFGQVQDAMNIIAVLKQRGISIDGFMEWGRYMKLPSTKATHGQIHTDKVNQIYTCPSCSLPLILIPVNSMPCNVVGGDYKSMLYCFNEFTCGYELYSNKTVVYWQTLSDGVSNLSISRSSGVNSGETNLKHKKCGGCGSK